MASKERLQFDTKSTDAQRIYSDRAYDFSQKIELLQAAIDVYNKLDPDEQGNLTGTHQKILDELDFLSSTTWDDEKIKMLIEVVDAKTDAELAQDYAWLSRQRELIEQASDPDTQSIANRKLLEPVKDRIIEAIAVNQTLTGKRDSRRTDLAHLIEYVIKARQGTLLKTTADGKQINARDERTEIEQQYSEAARVLALRRFFNATVDTTVVDNHSSADGDTVPDAQTGESEALTDAVPVDLFDHLQNWLDDPGTRKLPINKKLPEIKKFLHLGLMTLHPDIYVPKFRRMTSTQDYPNPLPTGISLDPDYRFGKSDIDPDQLEEAFKQALALFDQATLAINARDADEDLTIDESLTQVKPLYQVYEFYASQTVSDKIAKVEQPIRDLLRDDGDKLDADLADESANDSRRVEQIDKRVRMIESTLAKLRRSAVNGLIPPPIKQQNKLLQDRIKGWDALLQRRRDQLKAEQDFADALPGLSAEIKALLDKNPPQAAEAKKRITALYAEYGQVARDSTLADLWAQATEMSDPLQAYELMTEAFIQIRQRSNPNMTDWLRVVDQGVGQFDTEPNSTERNVRQTWQRGQVLYLYAQAAVKYLTCLDGERLKKDDEAWRAINAANDLVKKYTDTLEALPGDKREEIQDQIQIVWSGSTLAEIITEKFDAYHFWADRIVPLINQPSYNNRRYDPAYQTIKQDWGGDTTWLLTRLLNGWIVNVRQQARAVVAQAATNASALNVDLVEKIENDIEFLLQSDDTQTETRLPRLGRNDNEISEFFEWRLPFYIEHYHSEHRRGLDNARGPRLEGVEVSSAGVPLSTTEYSRWRRMLAELEQQNGRLYRNTYGDEADEIEGYEQIRQSYDQENPLDAIGQLLTARLSIPRQQMLLDAYLVICEAKILHAGMGSDQSMLLTEMRKRKSDLVIDLKPTWEGRLNILNAFVEGRIETLDRLVHDQPN